MKYSRILLLATVITTLLLSGCGTKDEPVTPAPIESESIEIAEDNTETEIETEPETETETETEIEEIVETETEPEVSENTAAPVNNYPKLDIKGNVIPDGKGNYTYSESWMGEFISIYDGFFSIVKTEYIAKLLQSDWVGIEIKDSTLGSEVYEKLGKFIELAPDATPEELFQVLGYAPYIEKVETPSTSSNNQTSNSNNQTPQQETPQQQTQPEYNGNSTPNPAKDMRGTEFTHGSDHGLILH